MCKASRNISYIGMTMRRLRDKIKEHLKPPSPIHDHLLLCNNCDKKNIEQQFTILDRAKFYNQLIRLEYFYINEKKPFLNTLCTSIFKNDYKSHLF